VLSNEILSALESGAKTGCDLYPHAYPHGQSAGLNPRGARRECKLPRSYLGQGKDGQRPPEGGGRIPTVARWRGAVTSVSLGAPVPPRPPPRGRGGVLRHHRAPDARRKQRRRRTPFKRMILPLRARERGVSKSDFPVTHHYQGYLSVFLGHKNFKLFVSKMVLMGDWEALPFIEDDTSTNFVVSVGNIYLVHLNAFVITSL